MLCSWMRRAAAVAAVLVATTFAAVAATPEFAQRARTTSWQYPADLTLEQARAKAKLCDEQGLNALLTEDHRYILPIDDDPKALNDPFHFKLQPTTKSHEATSNVVAAMRERNIDVIHHVTAAYCPKLEMEKHPDWCQQDIMDPEKPVFFKAYGGVYMYCLNNPNFRKAYFAAALDLQKKMKFSAWMIDEVEWLPHWYVCGCEFCRAKFTKETGYTLPTDKDSPVWGNFNDPVWRAWITSRMRSSGDFFKDLRAYFVANGVGDNVALTGCHAGMTGAWSSIYWGIDVIDLMRGMNWVFFEVYIGEDGAPIYSWRRVLAEIQAYGALARSRTHAPGLMLFYPRGDDNEKSWTWAAAFAMGQRMWGVMPQKNFTWERRHEALTYPNGREVVDAGVVFSKQTRDNTGYVAQPKYMNLPDANYNEGYTDEWAAWTEALMARNVPHRVLLDDELTSTDLLLAQYKALYVPNMNCMSEAQVLVLLDYAARGGKLVVSGLPARRDETGAVRPNDELTQRLLKAAALTLDSKMGNAAYHDYVAIGVPVKTGNKKALDTLADALAGVLAPKTLSFAVDAPEGVVVKVWENEMKSRVRIDALNCMNADLTSGAVIGKRYAVKFEHAKVSVTLNKDVAGTPDRAVMYDPETSTSKVIAVKRATNGDTVVEFDLTSALAVVELERAPLPRTLDWVKKQSADWFVLGTKLTPDQARVAADRTASNSLTTLLTDQQRYILYDVDEYDRLTTGTFHGIWQGRNLRTSVEMTRNLVDACHAKDIRVIWHTTYCMVSGDLLQRHPEWAQVDMRHPDKPSFFELYGGNLSICFNNVEARTAYFKRVADLTRETGVDGWMIDEVEWLPDWFACGCKTCRELFAKETGYKLPDGEKSPVHGNMTDPVWRAWIKWRMGCTGKFFRDLREYMDEQGMPDLAYTCCHAGTAATWSAQAWGIDEFELADGMNFCFYEAFIGNGAPYYSWKGHVSELDLYGAVARNKTPGMPVLALFYPRTQAESRFVTALMVWSGARPWITYENTPTDFAPLQRLREHQDFFALGDQTLMADVGLFFSKSSRDMLGTDPGLQNNQFYINHYLTWDITMTARNFPRQVLIDEDMTAEKLAPYRTIIVPQAECMSKATADALVAWGNKGGELILAGKVATRDETGAERQDKAVTEKLRLVARKVLPELAVSKESNIAYAITDKLWKDDRIAESVIAVNTLLDELQPVALWKCDAPGSKVAVRVWTMPDGSVTVHLLNTSGAVLVDGTIVPKAKDVPDGGVKYPVQ